jgi:uncharacterized membrane protein (DUF4010 family)
MALVVLPVLPAGPYGPLGGIRPRELWALVLFFSGLSFVGYVARQIAGPRHGYLVTGLLGGIVSSTNVTFTFARLSRDHRSAERELAWGAAAANAMLFPRVLVAVAVLNPSLVAWLAPYLVAPAFIAIAITVIGLRGSTEPNDGTPQRGNPLQLGHALQMTVLFQLVLTSVHLAGQFWGTSGVMATAAVLGLTDVDALTMSMARDVASSMSPGVAAAAIAIGITTNTLLKAALALVFGTPAFRLVTVTFLLAIGGALAVPLVF